MLDTCPQGYSHGILRQFYPSCILNPHVDVIRRSPLQGIDPTILTSPAYGLWWNSVKVDDPHWRRSTAPILSSTSWEKWIPHNLDIKVADFTFKAQYGEVIILQSVSQGS